MDFNPPNLDPVCPVCPIVRQDQLAAALAEDAECQRRLGVLVGNDASRALRAQRLFAMPHDHQHNPDPNENAARIVAESMMPSEKPPEDLEAAWQAWSASIQRVDERGMTLLRAAFEAGYDACRRRSGQ